MSDRSGRTARWDFATGVKSELSGIIGDSEEIFTLGFLQLCQLLFRDGLDILTEPAANAAAYQSIAGMHQMLMDDLEFSKKVAAQIHLAALYEVADPTKIRRLLKESGHRLLRLPPPIKPSGGTLLLERTESRDTLPVILAVPEYMKPADIAVLLRAWCR